LLSPRTTTINADDLVEATLKGVRAPLVKELPVVGALDQASDLSPVLEDPSGSQRMITALLEHIAQKSAAVLRQRPA